MSSLVIDNHIIKKDIRSILNELVKYAVPGKLKSIKYEPEDVRITCPVHKDGQENKPSCNIFIGESNDMVWGTTHCFACGFKGQLFDFVAEACDKSRAWAKKWLKDNFTETVIEGNDLIIDEPIRLDKNQSNQICLKESSLYNYQNWHPYLQKRKLSKEICEKFEVKYDPETECIVFPVRDFKGKLRFLTRRSVNSKKFIIDKNIDKEVYLLYNIVRTNIKEVYVCESQINALTLWSWGYPAIALLGTGSDYQYNLLNKSGILKYNLCFDGDEAGRKGIKNFKKNIKNCFISIVEIPNGKDVNDLTKEQFNKLEIIDV